MSRSSLLPECTPQRRRLPGAVVQLAVVCCALASLFSCHTERVAAAFSPNESYKSYTDALVSLGLDNKEIGRQWIAAGKRAMDQPVEVTLPFSEMGYFDSVQPDAVGYAFPVQRGQKIIIDLTVAAGANATYFGDLYRESGSNPSSYEHAATLPSGTEKLTFEPLRRGTYLFRVQPEIFVGGKYSLAIRVAPALAFPVQGKNKRYIGSFFGDPRDGGRRKHEGDDIFSAKGTNVLAPTQGRVVRVGTSELGGNIIYIWDGRRKLFYYFAHLEKQLVTTGQQVKAGDVIGLVDNTGDAKTTPSHLHFGVYTNSMDAIDPYYFIANMPQDPPTIVARIDDPNGWYRTWTSDVAVRKGPSPHATLIRMLAKDEVFAVTAASANYFRVRLTDGSTGYVYWNATEPAQEPIGSVAVPVPTELLSDPVRSDSGEALLRGGESVKLLGRSGAYDLVSAPGTGAGWIRRL